MNSQENFGFYEEVSDVLSLFKSDLSDQEVKSVESVLNHPDRMEPAFLAMLKELFTRVTRTSNQTLIIRFFGQFKEAFDGDANLDQAGEKMMIWSKQAGT